jgi:anti-sigma factor RsiW
MTRFNFKEACLLDASGELGPAARHALGAYLRENPEVRHEYHEICKQFELLKRLPPAELSAEQRAEIPAQLKATLQAAFRQQKHVKQAAMRRKLIRSALAGVASAAAAVVVVAALGGMGDRSWQAREREQLTRMESALARFIPAKDAVATSYDQAVTDMQASIRQLETDSPTLAQLHDRNMGDLLNVLSTFSQDWDDFALSEPPAPVTLPPEAPPAGRVPGKL